MKQIIPSKIAEIIFALIIGFFGVNHLMHADAMTGYVPDFMPGGGKIWVYVTGGAFILAALAIITGMMKSLASYLLALMLLIIALSIHLRGMMNATDDMMKTMFLTNLLKDSAMAMCAILVGNNSSK